MRRGMEEKKAMRNMPRAGASAEAGVGELCYLIAAGNPAGERLYSNCYLFGLSLARQSS